MLQLTFLNGDTKTFPFGPDSQLSVQTPDGANGIKHGSWGEIVALALLPDTADVPEPQPGDGTDATLLETAGTPEPDASVPAEDSLPAETEADPTPAPETESEPPASSDEPTSDTGSEPAPEPPEHDTAVSEANEAIVAVALGTSDPDALAKALADVTAALETYPDSAELQDAKTQLTDFTATE